jgi:hypothetical protein
MTRLTIVRITHLINLFDCVNNLDTTLVIKPSKEECCHSLVKFIGNQTSFFALNINNAGEGQLIDKKLLTQVYSLQSKQSTLFRVKLKLKVPRAKTYGKLTLACT